MPSSLGGNGEDRNGDGENRILYVIRNRNAEGALFIYAMTTLAAVGCLLILLYSLRFWASGQLLRILGVGMLAAGAALASGFLLGFIFAIPRVGGKDGRTTTAPPGGAQAENSVGQHGSVPFNENLVEISDWLTKIIVGVGLVELRSIPGKLGEWSYYLAPGLLPAPGAGGSAGGESIIIGQAAGLAIIIFYFTLGFLLGYVWTVIYFKRDLEAQVNKLKEEKAVEQRLRQVAIEVMPPQASVILPAEYLISTNQLDKAMASVDEALKNDPSNGLAVMTKARILKRQASQSAQPDRDRLLKEALAYVDQAIALLPNKGEPLYNKACYQALLDGKGLKSEILENLESAFRLNPALRQTATDDVDLASLKQDIDFIDLIRRIRPPNA
jgi:hypothetical protein